MAACEPPCLGFYLGLGTAVRTWERRGLPALPGGEQPQPGQGNRKDSYCHLCHMVDGRFLLFSFSNSTDLVPVTGDKETSPLLKSTLPLRQMYEMEVT